MSLLQRIEEICAMRGKDGTPLSYRELSRRSGLQQTAIGTMVSRLKRDPSTSVEVATLAKIAAGGNVRPVWLCFGEGKADAFVRDTLDHNAERQAAIEMAYSLGASDEAIQIVSRMEAPPGSGAPSDWLHAILANDERRRLEGGGLEEDFTVIIAAMDAEFEELKASLRHPQNDRKAFIQSAAELSRKLRALFGIREKLTERAAVAPEEVRQMAAVARAKLAKRRDGELR